MHCCFATDSEHRTPCDRYDFAKHSSRIAIDSTFLIPAKAVTPSKARTHDDRYDFAKQSTPVVNGSTFLMFAKAVPPWKARTYDDRYDFAKQSTPVVTDLIANQKIWQSWRPASHYPSPNYDLAILEKANRQSAPQTQSDPDSIPSRDSEPHWIPLPSLDDYFRWTVDVLLSLHDRSDFSESSRVRSCRSVAERRGFDFRSLLRYGFVDFSSPPNQLSLIVGLSLENSIIDPHDQLPEDGDRRHSPVVLTAAVLSEKNPGSSVCYLDLDKVEIRSNRRRDSTDFSNDLCRVHFRISIGLVGFDCELTLWSLAENATATHRHVFDFDALRRVSSL